METTSLRSLVKNGTVVNISVLRLNENNYPFLTLRAKDKKSANVYFTKTTSEFIVNHFNEGETVLEAIKDAEILKVENEQGETRYKIHVAQERKYASKSELESIFGLEETVGEFDITDFLQLFTTVASLQSEVKS